MRNVLDERTELIYLYPVFLSGKDKQSTPTQYPGKKISQSPDNLFKDFFDAAVKSTV